MAVFVAVLLAAWLYVTSFPMAFLESGYPSWVAKSTMLRNCQLGQVAFFGDSRLDAGIVPALTETTVRVSRVVAQAGDASPESVFDVESLNLIFAFSDCKHLFQRDQITSLGLRFLEEVQLHEDTIFCANYLHKSTSIGMVDDYVARTAAKVMHNAHVLDARVRLASGDGMLQLGN